MNTIEYLILEIAEEKGKFSVGNNDRGELRDTVRLLEEKGYLKNLGHSDYKGIWEYKITYKGHQALANNRSDI